MTENEFLDELEQNEIFYTKKAALESKVLGFSYSRYYFGENQELMLTFFDCGDPNIDYVNVASNNEGINLSVNISLKDLEVSRFFEMVTIYDNGTEDSVVVTIIGNEYECGEIA